MCLSGQNEERPWIWCGKYANISASYFPQRHFSAPSTLTVQPTFNLVEAKASSLLELHTSKLWLIGVNATFTKFTWLVSLPGCWSYRIISEGRWEMWNCYVVGVYLSIYIFICFYICFIYISQSIYIYVLSTSVIHLSYLHQSIYPFLSLYYLYRSVFILVYLLSIYQFIYTSFFIRVHV